jgi:hypothetical protein
MLVSAHEASNCNEGLKHIFIHIYKYMKGKEGGVSGTGQWSERKESTILFTR